MSATQEHEAAIADTMSKLNCSREEAEEYESRLDRVTRMLSAFDKLTPEAQVEAIWILRKMAEAHKAREEGREASSEAREVNTHVMRHSRARSEKARKRERAAIHALYAAEQAQAGQ